MPARTLPETLEAAQTASRALATLTSAQKDAALEAVAAALEAEAPSIIAANARDLEAGAESGLAAGLLDRLRLDEGRVAALARAVRDVIALPDPVGVVVRGSTLPNGVGLSQVRGMLGAS